MTTPVHTVQTPAWRSGVLPASCFDAVPPPESGIYVPGRQPQYAETEPCIVCGRVGQRVSLTYPAVGYVCYGIAQQQGCVDARPELSCCPA